MINQEFEKAFEAEQSKMNWVSATEHEKTLVILNCNRVALWAAKWMAERCAREVESGITREAAAAILRQLGREL